jgi:hypothetical protein
VTGSRQPAHRDGQQVVALVTDDGLDVDGVVTSWLDIDDVREGDHRVALVLADGSELTLTHLGQTHDRFMRDLREARRRVRLAALTMATGTPLHSYESRLPAGFVDVHLYAKAVALEPRIGRPDIVPLSLVSDVTVEGHTIRLACRGIDDVDIAMLGQRTDEFLDRLSTARSTLQAATEAAYVAFDPALAGHVAADGWAITREEAPAAWQVLRDRAAAGDRATEVALFEELAGDRLAFGLFTDGGAHPLPFLLAPVGNRIAVEAVDNESRATFIFKVTNLAELNAVLILTAFRREALSLPFAELGRWTVAARTSPIVQWARAAYSARVVHDANWATSVRTGLA